MKGQSIGRVLPRLLKDERNAEKNDMVIVQRRSQSSGKRGLIDMRLAYNRHNRGGIV